VVNFLSTDKESSPQGRHQYIVMNQQKYHHGHLYIREGQLIISIKIKVT
jgi:hypothetical protein